MSFWNAQAGPRLKVLVVFICAAALPVLAAQLVLDMAQFARVVFE